MTAIVTIFSTSNGVFRAVWVLLAILALGACAHSKQHAAQPNDGAITNAEAALLEPTASSVNALPDVDNDGVPDAQDSCGETLPLRPVDQAGCELFEGKLENVEFAPDAHGLNEESKLALNRLIEDMQSHPDVVLAISGHTDNRGNARDNLELSKKRVLSVVRYMVLNGINGRRLHPHGYGESRPLFSNATEEGRKRNRRIEISLIPAQ